eukprot:COSAG02_NODE_53036_length_304_cov_0.751220_1_plen_59_part_00
MGSAIVVDTKARCREAGEGEAAACAGADTAGGKDRAVGILDSSDVSQNQLRHRSDQPI